MQIYTHTLPGGAQIIGYLRDRTVEMPAFNTRPAILILPGCLLYTSPSPRD